MHHAVAGMALQERFEIVVVPAGAPQTKPRALNYALSFSRGDLVTIYDAEDLPEPLQLRKVVQAFAEGSPELACIQAELRFFNWRHNWLSRQFTLEYASLFRVILPALAGDQLPLPLGGTSNHFKRRALEQVGAWDPFNVTEDADLGLRLARAGFKTGVVDSWTLEEANVRYISWIKQRSRWLKGFLMTWLVQMRHPWRSFRELGPTGFWVMSTMTLGVFLSSALHPLFLFKIAFDLLSSAPPDEGNVFGDIVLGTSMLLFLGGYITAFLIARKGAGRHPRWLPALFTMPIYWLLFMPAAWLALYEAIFKPFHWHKTQHGVVQFELTPPGSDGSIGP